MNIDITFLGVCRLARYEVRQSTGCVAAEQGALRAAQYLDSFDDIRLVQAYILGRARKNEVPVIENGNIENAIIEVMELVLTAAEPLQVRS